jgi:hypothetical protein
MHRNVPFSLLLSRATSRSLLIVIEKADLFQSRWSPTPDKGHNVTAPAAPTMKKDGEGSGCE